MITIETAGLTDVAEITNLYQPANKVSFNDFLERVVECYPSATARLGSQLVGFAFTSRFAADILELNNIYVAATCCDRNIGSLLLQHIEQTAVPQYSGVVAVNSDLHVRKEPKRPATDFYLQNGYHLALETTGSRVFVKTIR